jgi:AcrR family transcriptional regulator
MNPARPPTEIKSSPRFDRTSDAILDAAAHVFSEQGAGANLAAVASAAGVSRATLYRYYASREALLGALVIDALSDATNRLADAGLERAPVEDAIERILRAFVTVGDRYSVLIRDLARFEEADTEQLNTQVRAVLARGIETGVLRTDVSVEVLDELLHGVAVSAIKLTQRHHLGLEEAAAAAARLFLDGARPR